MKNIWLKNFLITISLTSIVAISFLVLTNCASSNANGNNNQSPPNNETNPSPSKPLEPPVLGNPFSQNDYGLASPNPNFENDPKNSFLISPNGPPSGSGQPSEGVARNARLHFNTLLTQTDIKNISRCYSLGFENDGSQIGGTGWILDYQIPDDVDNEKPNGNTYDDNNYPTTWYFGTNAHVLDDLLIPNDQLYPHPDPTINTNIKKQTSTINLWNPLNDNEQPQLNLDYGDSIHWNWKMLQIYDKNDLTHTNPKAKRIFIGNDFLTTKPGDYNQSERFQNYEEYADFGVFEYTFASSEQAKVVTKNYANQPVEQKFRYKKDDLLHGNIPNNGLYQIGFPSSDSNSFNPTRICLNRPENDASNKGSSLSTSPYYNNVDNHPGILDNAIGLSGWFGYQFENVQTYIVWGLNYATNYSSMRPGSSGSLVTDEQGYAISIHYASDEISSTGLSQAFYSKGFNYQGKYGNYNLPAYDLISGYVKDPNEFPYQKSSYRDNLLKLYGNQANYRTNLFPNGIKR